jgi:hypothetical protein
MTSEYTYESDPLRGYINQIKTENEALKKRIVELEESLKKYTSTHRQKKYYENHSNDVIQKNKEYTKKVRETNPEKVKEWNRTAYLKRKEKLKAERDAKKTIYKS